MQRFSLGIMRIRDGDITGTATVYAGRRMLEDGAAGRRPRGRPETRYLGVAREDMKLVAREHDSAVIHLHNNNHNNDK